jgi:hypothetical protein
MHDIFASDSYHAFRGLTQMLGSTILDVAIGMALIYLFLSLIASVLQEALAAVVQSRAANLQHGLLSLFSGDLGPDGKSLLNSLYNHGLIRGLYRDPKKDTGRASHRLFDTLRLRLQSWLGWGPVDAIPDVSNPLLLPSYIPSRVFSLAMADILNPDKGTGILSLPNIRQHLVDASQRDPYNKALEGLSALAINAGSDLKTFEEQLENWYNDAMDRVSGWYKKHTQNILLIIGLLLAIVFNVSSIRIASALWTDKDARGHGGSG